MKNSLSSTIRFKKADPNSRDLIFAWLDEPHVRTFWDNSQEHRDDIMNFINGRPIPSPYFGGIFDYWVGSINDTPFCLIMTHEESPKTGAPKAYLPYLSKTGKTFGLDFCIGNKQYLGQGLAAPTLLEFMEYFIHHVEPEADTFLIDPSRNNLRAIHVYEKAGFKIVKEFSQQGGYFDQEHAVLMIKTINSSSQTV